MRATIVLPTYNERENIAPMLDAILTQDVPDLHVLVVDDSSPDGTGDIARAYAARDPRVSVLSRPKKEGLCRAYVAGFHEVIRRGAEAVIQMDADFSHDPADIPRLLSHLARGDMIIGSRYLHGEGVTNWSPARRWLSKAANVYARLVTGVPVTDLTGGFTAIRTSTLRTLDIDTLRADGYGFQIEVKTRAHRHGARLEEIPIVFQDRRVGHSKLSRAIVLEAVWLVWKLRFQQTRK